jgi:hypothetical protein
MRRLLIFFLALAALWYYFVGGRRMDEAQIRTAYDRYWAAFYNDDRKAICDMFDNDFSAKITTETPKGAVTETADRKRACEDTKQFFDMKDAMEAKLGQELYVNMEHTIDSIQLSADRKSATVEMSFEIRIGTEHRLFMKIAGSQTDTAIRRMGKVKFLNSESEVSFY